MEEIYNIARKLRKNSTEQERIMWKLLRNRKFKNLKFKRQVPVGNYVADFLCEEKKLIIEIDGGQHNESENIIKDNTRTKYFESEGYNIIRFWNNEVTENLSGVYDKLSKIVEEIN